MSRLVCLWRGELPLAQTFWTWAGLGALLVNGLTSLGFFALIAEQRPWAALLVGYGLSLPYNLVVLVGLWRAAGRNGTSAGVLARWAGLLWLLLLSVT